MTLLTIKEASKEIRMSEGWIRQAIRAGELRIVRFGKVRGVRIRPEDLRAFVERRIEGTSSCFQQEMTELTKIARQLNQHVTHSDQ